MKPTRRTFLKGVSALFAAAVVPIPGSAELELVAVARVFEWREVGCEHRPHPTNKYRTVRIPHVFVEKCTETVSRGGEVWERRVTELEGRTFVGVPSWKEI